MSSEGSSGTSPNGGASCAVCGVAAAVLYCAADAAALCAPCDAAIHASNPLASRHQRVPLSSAATSGVYDYGDLFAADDDMDSSWPTPTPGQGSPNSSSSSFSNGSGGAGRSLFYLLSDVDLMAASGADGVTPLWMMVQPGVDVGGPAAWTSCSSHSEAVVVPSGAAAEFQNLAGAMVAAAADREAKVRRYREKREKRKFHKTIRYASRKAYAEARPRIKGRFVKRAAAASESEHDSTNGAAAEGGNFWLSFSDADSRDGGDGFHAAPAYGVVPSF